LIVEIDGGQHNHESHEESDRRRDRKLIDGGGSLIVMSIVGGAIMTPLMGWIAETRTIELAYVVPLVCYCVVAFYSYVGARMAPRLAAS